MVVIIDKRKQKVQEEIEEIDVMGQESEKKAAPYVKEYTKKRKKEDGVKKSQYLDDLSKKSRFTIKSYKHQLIDIVSEVMASKVDVPKGWVWDFWSNDKGVGISIKFQQSGWNHKAFKPCGIPEYDLSAAADLCEWAQNWFDRVEQEIESYKIKKSNGIIKPNDKE